MRMGASNVRMRDGSRVIDLETLLPADALSSSPEVVGFAAGVGVFFLQTGNGLFSIDPNSSQAKKVHDGTDIRSVRVA